MPLPFLPLIGLAIAAVGGAMTAKHYMEENHISPDWEELREINRRGWGEVVEVATDGFVETVVKGNSDYKTSYEKRDQADELVASAKSEYLQSVKKLENAVARLAKRLAQFEELKGKAIVDSIAVRQWVTAVENGHITYDARREPRRTRGTPRLATLDNLKEAYDGKLSSLRHARKIDCKDGIRLTVPRLFGPDMIISYLGPTPRIAIYFDDSQNQRVRRADTYLREARQLKQETALVANSISIDIKRMNVVHKRIQEGCSLLATAGQLLDSQLELATQTTRVIEGSKADLCLCLIDHLIALAEVDVLGSDGSVADPFNHLLSETAEVARLLTHS